MTLDYATLRSLRAEDPDAVIRAAAERVRPTSLLPGDGKLMLIAADHPARNAFAVDGDPMAMADREVLLDRLVEAIGRPGVDGVLGTADILDDLLLLGVLDGKVVIGSMNRGGLAGASFEFDDRFAAYDADTIAAMGFQGGKMLTRIALDDDRTADTLAATAQAVNDLADAGLMAMVEPFMSERIDGKVRNVLSTDAVMKSMGIAAALGRTSRHTWLKVPVVADMDRVMTATTMPTLLLGGDPSGDPADTYASWASALAAPGVRGLIVGRSMLYPRVGDVSTAVDTATALVHPAASNVGS